MNFLDFNSGSTLSSFEVIDEKKKNEFCFYKTSILCLGHYTLVQYDFCKL